MADTFYTMRRVVLPVPLLDRIALYLKQKDIPDTKARHLVNLCMDKIDSFDTQALYVSGIDGYGRCITELFSEDTRTVSFCLKPDYWERLLLVQNQYNIGAGDIIRLVLGTYLFHSGETALPLAELAEVFISGRKTYQYNLVLTEPIDRLLSGSSKFLPHLNREIILRASSYCYEKQIKALPELASEELYRVDNQTVGWKRVTVHGSLRMKDYFQTEKAKTGKPMGLLMAHTLYSFLEGFGGGRRDD